VSTRCGPKQIKPVGASRSTSSIYPKLSWVASPLLLAVCLVACPPSNDSSMPDLTASSVQVFRTTGDRTELLQQQPSIALRAAGGMSGMVITVDPTKQYQTIDGFGGSFSDSSAWLIWNKLTSAQQTTLMQQLFSRTEGIGLSFLRQPMGASDFSASGNYSYDDMPSGQTDPSLLHFSIAHDKAYVIPLLQRALTINPSTKIVALPWSSPAWMKTTITMNGGTIDPQYYSALAQYFVKYVQAYQQSGISTYALSVQNEPLYSTTAYPTAYMPAADEGLFIANFLGPALSQANLSNVKVLAYEHNWDTPTYATTILSGAAATFVAGTSFHCYAGDPSAQSTVKTAYPAKDIWFTECSGITSTTFANDLVWNAEQLLIGASRNWARSISLWNLALDQNSGPKNGSCMNCRGLVTIDDSVSPASVTLNVEYYILGHLSKFVVPGAHRIDSNTFGPGSVEDVAFRNPDGSIVLLVLNSGSSPNTFTASFSGRAFTYSLPAGALATIVSK
jgi:glucosylceramidase